MAAIERIIDHCPTTEWKLLFALARSIPTRITSEIEELTWADINWEQNNILIHSPKTKHFDKYARLVPIFPLLKKWLEIAFNEAQVGALHIFPTLRHNTNPATNAKKIVLRAKVEPWVETTWVNFWNSLRATTETDLMDQHGLRRACQWLGNSVTTAMKNYALVRNTDFQDVGKVGKADAQCAASSADDAKCDAGQASTAEQNPKKRTHSRES